MSVADECGGGRRERERERDSGQSKKRDRHTEGEKLAATGGREKREKPGQLSLASWDHDLVAIAHQAWQSGAVLVDMNPLG